jgi:hypothetical protein
MLLNSRMTVNDKLKKYGRKIMDCFQLVLRVYQHLPAGTEENNEIPQNSQTLGRNWNLGPLEYKGLSITQQ